MRIETVQPSLRISTNSFMMRLFSFSDCDTREIPGSPAFFEQYLEGWGYIPMPCAPGTIYNKTVCMCDDVTKVIIQGRSKTFYKFFYKFSLSIFHSDFLFYQVSINRCILTA